MSNPNAALLATACLFVAAVGGEASPTTRPPTLSDSIRAQNYESSATSTNSTRLSVVMSPKTAWLRRWASGGGKNVSEQGSARALALIPWARARARRLYRTADTEERGGRAVWSVPSANSAAGADVEADYDSYRKAYVSKPFDYNSSWWSSMQTGMPAVVPSVNSINSLMMSSPLTPVRRGSHYHSQPNRQYQPFLAAHWDDQDYGDYAAGGSQVVAVSHPHQHSHQPVYYMSDPPSSKDSPWNDLTTKLIIAAFIKLLIVKAMGLTAFKLLAIGFIKVPIVLAALGLKFAFIVKFFKFIKVLVAVIIIPLILVALIPLLIPILIPLFLVLLPLVLLPLLLLFPVPVLTPGTTTGGGTVITITPGRRRREEEEQALNRLENRVMDSRRCLQKLACDVGSRSQVVKPYADWVMRLLNYMKPILSDNKRIQLKGFLSAYKSGLAGRSCYRKYPCYSNNMNTISKAAVAGTSSSEDGERSSSSAAIDSGESSVSLSLEHREDVSDEEYNVDTTTATPATATITNVIGNNNSTGDGGSGDA